MNRLNRLLSFCVAVAFLSACSSPDIIHIDSENISLGFERKTGKLVSFTDNRNDRELIDSSAVKGLPWKLTAADPDVFNQDEGYTVSFKKRGKSSVDIIWQYNAAVPLRVEMSVFIEKDKPMTHWRASFSGLKGVRSDEVCYPVVSGMYAYPNADLVQPSWLGLLTHNPAANASEAKPAVYTRSFPFSSLQLMAVYDRESLKSGLYFSSQDTTSSFKSMTISMTPEHIDCIARCKVPDKTVTDVFSPQYDILLGVFDGNWVSASAIYREWAVNQRFCRESRFHNGASPEWLAKTAFWIWNRGRSENVLDEVEDFQDRLGLPVSAYWHWWHGCSYDEGFPEYVPPREGRESFTKALERARKKGIHSIVYMNSYQWGDSTESWEEEGAGRYAARRENGNTYRHVYNLFSKKGLTPMCMATQFWRDKYASLCDTVVNHYHTDGVYMDQACSGMACYNPDHGHPVGGGSYWHEGFVKLTDQIRSTFQEGADAVLAGEGSAEDWIPVLDDFLTLEPSYERYSGVTNREPIPLFQAVYHEYAITYGSYSSLVYPPYDEMWPKEFRPSNSETLLPEEFNLQFRMEQARAFTWGMQPTLANYHSFLFETRKNEMEYLVDLLKTRYNALDYLLYGSFVDIVDFPSVQLTIPMSRVSIYAGRTGKTVTRCEKQISTVFSAAWRSRQGNLGIAISNIADEPAEVVFKVEAEKYGLSGKGTVSMISASGKEACGQYAEGDEIICQIPPRSNRVLEFAE